MFNGVGRTGIVAAAISIAIVLFEVLPVTITNTTTTMMAFKDVVALSSTIVISELYAARDSDEHAISVVHLSALYDRTKSTKLAVNGITDADKKCSSSSSYYPKKNNTKKFVHSSIRIEEDVLNALQSEAQRRDISFNSLVNKTLRNYVTSEMYFEQLGFILVSKDFLRKTFLKLDENYVEEFGRELGLTVAKEYISYFSGQANTSTLLEFLDIWFRRFQFCQHRIGEEKEDVTLVTYTDSVPTFIEKQQEQKEKVHLFIVIHDINMNFSLVLRSMLEGLVEPITKSPVIFRDITSSSIIFLIKT